MRSKSRGRMGFVRATTTQNSTELRIAVEFKPIEPRPQRLGLRDAMAKVVDDGGAHGPDAPRCAVLCCHARTVTIR
jgi:hypothetical protein